MNYFFSFGTPSSMLSKMESIILEKFSPHITETRKIETYQNANIVLSIQLDQLGICLPYYEWLSSLQKTSFAGSSAILIVHSPTDLYSKTIVQQTIFVLNQLGCSFIGRPYVEATASLKNFLTLQKVFSLPLEEVCLVACEQLVKKFLEGSPSSKKQNLLVLHASNYVTSNTLAFWHMVREQLTLPSVREIHIENGTVRDCKGCPYKTCVHYGEQSRCFYGGIMVEEIYPAILESDALLLLCPNYNDALSANIAAVINRLTALFRMHKFYEKGMFGIIVSGNSGSEILARQLISALNCNKTFFLPPNAFAMVTANDFGSIRADSQNQQYAKDYAKHIDDYFNLL